MAILDEDMVSTNGHNDVSYHFENGTCSTNIVFRTTDLGAIGIGGCCDTRVVDGGGRGATRQECCRHFDVRKYG